ncbi:MAG: methylated-DNA--[protein]-cysteine S-methyltransferase [Oscillospiraceae bacterium]|nr:methylated-DNA--[protein]-cysteine S-methyltransferase [Oscillospiraceae bacterium]
MAYTSIYTSPFGEILLAADGIGLTGLWFKGQKYYAADLGDNHEERKMPVLDSAGKWLDIYFSGREPNFTPKIHLVGTDFQLSVWNILNEIPYGETVTYGYIARQLEKRGEWVKMSAQAVGGAVGHNKISIIVPCHRVVGAKGGMTGYAAGIDTKIALLSLEKNCIKSGGTVQ